MVKSIVSCRTPFGRSNYGSFFDLAKVFDGLNNLSNFGFNEHNSEIVADLQEDEHSYTLEVEAPGVKQDQINLSFEDDELKVTINNETKREEKGRNYRIQERSFGSVSRSFSLPYADEDSVEAVLSNGVLSVKIKKYPESKAKKITINSR